MNSSVYRSDAGSSFALAVEPVAHAQVPFGSKLRRRGVGAAPVRGILRACAAQNFSGDPAASERGFESLSQRHVLKRVAANQSARGERILRARFFGFA